MKRKELLINLITMNGKIDIINSELSKFGWDYTENLVILKREHILKVLNKFLKGEISAHEVENWANLIECREDIGIEKQYKETINEAIFELANTCLTGALSIEKVKLLCDRLA